MNLLSALFFFTIAHYINYKEIVHNNPLFFFFLMPRHSAKAQGVYYKRIHFQLELVRDNIQFIGSVSFPLASYGHLMDTHNLLNIELKAKKKKKLSHCCEDKRVIDSRLLPPATNTLHREACQSSELKLIYSREVWQVISSWERHGQKGVGGRWRFFIFF